MMWLRIPTLVAPIAVVKGLVIMVLIVLSLDMVSGQGTRVNNINMYNNRTCAQNCVLEAKLSDIRSKITDMSRDLSKNYDALKNTLKMLKQEISLGIQYQFQSSHSSMGNYRGSGEQGPPGKPGPVGPRGTRDGSLPGPRGLAGSPGPRGLTGLTGYSARALQGRDGMRGLPGARGPQGHPGVYTVFQEDPGNPGYPGPEGYPGKPGPDGPPGKMSNFSDMLGEYIREVIQGCDRACWQQCELYLDKNYPFIHATCAN